MRKKNLTVIVVPEADRSVRRFRTSRTTILVILAAWLSLLIAFFIWLGWKKHAYDGTVDRLENQIAAGNHSHEQQLMIRDDRIERLQQEIILLTEQTEEVRTRLLELQQLESEIEALTGLSMSSAVEDEDKPVQAAGGAFQQAEPEQILELAEVTGQSLSALSRSLAHMSDRLSQLIAELEHLHYLDTITPSIWPAEGGQLSSGYGYRLDPFTRRSAFHSGIDIEGDKNDEIYAAATGVIAETGRTSNLGNYIIIDHSLGVRTLYAHLNDILVDRDDHVVKGELIGLMGSTGRSTGPHLHYEVHKHGSPIDPRPYIPD